jgi:hypothetical protein
VLNAAMEHSGRSLARVAWTAVIAAAAVVLAACSIALFGVEDPLLIAVHRSPVSRWPISGRRC